MRLNYIEKIRANIPIVASHKTTHLLDGLHRSVYQGRSLDFDDLREYVMGDNSKDIDWKSSIRHGGLLVWRYEASRRHNILFVLDNGERMMGETPAGEEKGMLALYAFGTLGYLANKNGDEVGVMYSAERGSGRGSSIGQDFSTTRSENGTLGVDDVYMSRFRASLPQLNMMINAAEREMTNPNPRTVNDYLEYILKHQRRRMIVVVISDLGGMVALDEQMVRKIVVNHDLLFISLKDAEMAEPENKLETYDINARENVPEFFSKNKKLAEMEKETKRKLFAEKSAVLKKYKITTVEISKKAEIVDKIIDLLERHNQAVRRK